MRQGLTESDALARADHWLRQMYGPDAAFRPGQWEAIRIVAVDRARLLLVQATGWGKSLVYYLATRLLREAGGGPTLIISPLVSLMRNQREMAAGLGLRAETIIFRDDANDEAMGRFRDGSCDALLVSPERLANESFRELLAEATRSVGLLVVDEAH